MRPNPNKRRLVKQLTLKAQHGSFRNLQLVSEAAEASNRGAYDGAVGERCFCFPSLLYLVNSRGVNELRTIPAAWSHSNAYDCLLYRLRDSLEEVKPTYSGCRFELPCIRRYPIVFGRLDTFRKLKTLTLKVLIGERCRPYLLAYCVYKYPNIETIIVEKLHTIEACGGTGYLMRTIGIEDIRDILGKIQHITSFYPSALSRFVNSENALYY
ncbi:hypothetical protein [Parasitella parasitica]|uniref:Uncharacterized protein n=1 Tax=Parasitella parasitica TaxID=35722 RepID=A0A0B7MV64_9FUNG|nr:hypothetical protein [Parasitella parasitica]